MASLSSIILKGVSEARNPRNPVISLVDMEIPSRNPIRVFCAEFGYLIVIPIALIEATLSALTYVLISLVEVPESDRKRTAEQFKSSCFSVLRAVVNVILNPFKSHLTKMEAVAIEVYKGVVLDCWYGPERRIPKGNDERQRAMHPVEEGQPVEAVRLVD